MPCRIYPAARPYRTIDRLLCAFTLGSTAAAMDIETHLYFTFWGLNMLKKGALEKAGLPATYKQYEEMLKTKLKEINREKKLRIARIKHKIKVLKKSLTDLDRAAVYWGRN